MASSASSLRLKTIKAKHGLLLVFHTSTRGPNFSNALRKSDSVQLTGMSLTCTRTPSVSPLALRLRRLRRLGLRLRCRLRLRLLLLLLDDSRPFPISGLNKNITHNNKYKNSDETNVAIPLKSHLTQICCTFKKSTVNIRKTSNRSRVSNKSRISTIRVSN